VDTGCAMGMWTVAEQADSRQWQTSGFAAKQQPIIG